jgi:hypothetical protein
MTEEELKEFNKLKTEVDLLKRLLNFQTRYYPTFGSEASIEVNGKERSVKLNLEEEDLICI